MRRKAFSITVIPELYEAIKQIADEQNRTLSNLVETILQEWLDNNK